MRRLIHNPGQEAEPPLGGVEEAPRSRVEPKVRPSEEPLVRSTPGRLIRPSRRRRSKRPGAGRAPQDVTGGEEARSPWLVSVVIGVDFGEASIAAARWATTHFAPGAAPTLVHVIRSPGLLRILRDGSAPADEQPAEAAGRRLAALREEIGAAGASAVVRAGEPAQQIVSVATEQKADLVVVGDQQQGWTLWDLVSSTAEQVAHLCTTPVLIARALPEGPPRRILVAVDESTPARAVLDWARRLQEPFAAPVEVVHAVDVMTPPHEEQRSLVDARLRGLTAQLRERIAAAGLSGDRVKVRVAVGDPRSAILTAASRFGAELVVLGCSGAGTVGRLLVDSTTGRVIRNSPCPVLLVPDPNRSSTEKDA